MIGNDARVRVSQENSTECRYPWQSVRILQHVPRPGTKLEDDKIYTAVYYEQEITAGNYSRYIALYRTKTPRFETCNDKFANRYGSPDRIEKDNPPVAMTIYEGDFALQTTDDPNGGVPLEKLPLVFGPKDPIVTKK
jgi:hypothetical protein